MRKYLLLAALLTTIEPRSNYGIRRFSITEDLWSLAWFNNKLYASSMENVFLLQIDPVIPKV